jgi:anti-anti-sigma factor
MGIALEKGTQSVVLRMDGIIDIVSAQELKEHLVRALEDSREIQISIDAVTDLDVTAMQLLWAAGRAARESGVAFALTGPAPKHIASAIGEAGFDMFAVFAEAR